MTERRANVYALLSRPGAYNLLQRVFGSQALLSRFVRDFLRPAPGERILDIGCGTGTILEHLPDVAYIGFEPNAAYVASARARFGGRATFHVGFFDAAAAAALEPVDAAMVVAVLHHMSDEEGRELFRLLRTVVKPGGRVVTLDNVYVRKQNPLARLIISLDRGRNVRTPDGYAGLARGAFAAVDGTVVHQRFPPYTYWMMTAA